MVSEFVFELILLIHFDRPLLDHFPLVPDAQPFQFVEAEVHFGIKMGREHSCGVHMKPGLIMVPKNLVRLVLRWQSKHWLVWKLALLAFNLGPVDHAVASTKLDVATIVHILKGSMVFELLFADWGYCVVDRHIGE